MIENKSVMIQVMALVPKKHQASAWTNIDPLSWLHLSLTGLNELSNLFICHFN